MSKKETPKDFKEKLEYNKREFEKNTIYLNDEINKLIVKLDQKSDVKIKALEDLLAKEKIELEGSTSKNKVDRLNQKIDFIKRLIGLLTLKNEENEKPIKDNDNVIPVANKDNNQNDQGIVVSDNIEVNNYDNINDNINVNNDNKSCCAYILNNIGLTTFQIISFIIVCFM